jgi:alpha-tubulin suppressor-like RCC1 family protein
MLSTFFKSKDVMELACGVANFAITNNGDLYVWGLYNETHIKIPTKLIENSDLNKIVSSISSFTAGVDKFSRLWVRENTVSA